MLNLFQNHDYTVGKVLTQEMIDALPINSRVWKPNSAGTTDWKPSRLNIAIDGNQVITRVWYG